MKSVYLVRHQLAGFLTDLAFAEPPTPEQLAPIEARLELIHGPAWFVANLAELHTIRPGERPPWFTVVEVPLHESEVPAGPAVVSSPATSSQAPNTGKAEAKTSGPKGTGSVT